MHFVSYSRADGAKFVRDLSRELTSGFPSVRLWIDKQELRPGLDWDDQIAAAIRDCETFLFVMTPDSVARGSVCKQEWTHALKYKKPIIPLHLHPNATLPFRLNTRQWLHASHEDLKATSSRLWRHWIWLKSPEGQLRLREEILEDAYRDLRRAKDGIERARIDHEIRDLKADIEELQAILGDEQAQHRMNERLRVLPEKNVEQVLASTQRQGPRVVNPPPAVPSDSFQDRRWETALLAEYLRNPAVRLITISGPESIGKTAMVCRLLQRALAGDHDESGPVPLDGVVYLDARSEPSISEPVLREALSRLLPRSARARVRRLFRDPAATQQQRLRSLLTALGGQRVVVLLDGLEQLVDPKLHELRDGELAATIRFFQNPELDHDVKLIVTSRTPIAGLTSARPMSDAFRLLALNEGLPSPYAEEVLRALDKDGTVGLRDAPMELLERARRLTNGNPMALEMIYAILRADRLTNLGELLDAVASLEPDKVLEDFLLREALSRLDERERKVAEALAVYQVPVEPSAVEYLLRPYGAVLDAATMLDRLSGTELVRCVGGQYQLPARYWGPVLDRIPWQPPSGWDGTAPAYAQAPLLCRAAEFFEGNLKPRVTWRERDDLRAQLIEFDLLVRAEEYDVAAWGLLQIDADYLLPWGHAREVLERHQRLQGRIEDPELVRLNLGRLGSAYLELGDYPKAIDHYEQALDMSGTPAERKPWVHNLGSSLFKQGSTSDAVRYFEEALALARSTDDHHEQATPLAGLGLCYRDLGDYDAALQHTEEALEIAETAGDLRLKAEQLAVMGTLLAELDRPVEARHCMEEAFALAEGRRYQLLRANSLADQAELLLDRCEDREAANVAEYALRCNRRLGKLELVRQGSYVLALACLRTGNLECARHAADRAADCHPWRWWHPAPVVQGIVRLHTSDNETAVDAFNRGVTEAEDLLEQDSNPYPAHDAMGLGLLGLAVAGERRQASAAIASFKAARERTRAPGVVQRVGRLIDDLARVDPERVVERVRTVATG